MILDIKQSLIDIEYRGVVSVEDAVGARIDCLRGRVWITEYRATGDIVLEAGDSYELSRSGVAVVQALRDALVAVRAPTTLSAKAQSMLPQRKDPLARLIGLPLSARRAMGRA